MKNGKVNHITRLLLFTCGLGLLSVLFTPIWRIDLQAPQYPEGLRLFIYANKLAGDVNIINGLNHYIGMKTLHTEDFPEFKILPRIIVAFSIFFILAGIVAKTKWTNILFVLFVAFGVLAMIDFWRWEYDYGHNLDPSAAIIVPGMAYQPPLIGFKQLLNFGAYSVPTTGGWIFIAVGILLLACVIAEWRKENKQISQRDFAPAMLLVGILMSISGCNTSPQAIRTGQDNCDFCKMAISDARFGAEIVTRKGKIYKFDDTHCIIGFLGAEKLTSEQINGIYFTDFNSPHQLLPVEGVHFLQSPAFKSPMNGNIGAFSEEDSLANALSLFKGNKISWEEMQK